MCDLCADITAVIVAGPSRPRCSACHRALPVQARREAPAPARRGRLADTGGGLPAIAEDFSFVEPAP